VNIDNFLETGTFGRDPSLAVIGRYTRAEGIALWKLPGFDFQAEEVDRLIDAVVKDASSVVVDLRGNGGGSVKTLEHMTGRFTEADVIMTDGKSLEHAGVTPDELMRPTPADLAAGRDPVLARAVEMLGGTLDPASAGKIFPIEWK
jgi:C-terminal processing protease CtpA/Prc